MTLDHDFGYSLPLFSSLLKKGGKMKRRMNIKNLDQKAYLSARSLRHVVNNQLEKRITNAKIINFVMPIAILFIRDCVSSFIVIFM